MTNIQVRKGDKENVLLRGSVAKIDARKCINCGTCREYCPVEAIKEHQRSICHTCPICTDKPGFPPQKVDSLPTETSCTVKCPLGISPQGYVNLTRIGKLNEAYELIWSKNPLPSVCAHVCHHPCEEGCKRGIIVDNPIAIRGIKRYLSENVDFTPKKYQRVFDEKVAVIGAGPAGISAAHYLLRSGYRVTVFEGDVEPGGMLLKGIPEFRLNRKVVRDEIAKLQEAGMEIRCNERLDKKSFEDLKNDYDAIIVATGTPTSKELMIENWRCIGVMTAIDFMQRVNNHQDIRRHIGQVFDYKDKKAVIIGGGSVAVDAARAAVRMGASSVTMACLESGDAIPAHKWELDEAKEEGVQIIEGVSPARYTTDLYPHLTGIDFRKVTKFEKVNGKLNVETDQENIIHVEADWVVVAIGQKADDFWKQLDDENIFFAGDIASAKCSVIDAMASGRAAAFAVEKKFRGFAKRDPMENHELLGAPITQKIYPYNRRKNIRPAIHKQSPEERIRTFDEFEGCFTDEELRIEVESCLECGYEEVDTAKCIGCGICQKLCPKGDVITMVAAE